jgi:hypothetical protein
MYEIPQVIRIPVGLPARVAFGPPRFRHPFPRETMTDNTETRLAALYCWLLNFWLNQPHLAAIWWFSDS